MVIVFKWRTPSRSALDPALALMVEMRHGQCIASQGLLILEEVSHAEKLAKCGKGVVINLNFSCHHVASGTFQRVQLWI